MFTGMPEGARKFLHRGFRLLSRIDPKHYEQLVNAVIESLGSNYIEPAEFAAQIGVTEDEAGALLAAASVFATLLSSRKELPEDLLRAAAEADLLDSADFDAALRFAALLSDRNALKGALESSRIASAVLPSITTFDATVDLRFGFEKDQIAFAVPVVVVHLDTDSTEQEIWFQLTRKETERLIDNLKAVLKKINIIEQWSQKV